MDFKPAPIRPAVTVADLEKIDIRVGTILTVEDVSGSDKLLRLVVDFGDHQRNILAGMKQERENARSIEGKQALFVVNLEPKKMRGEISEGMLFDIGYADGILPVLALSQMERELDDTRNPHNFCRARRTRRALSTRDLQEDADRR
jgi:tRNA-binding protein